MRLQGQGTQDVVYHELELNLQNDDSYTFTMSIHRVTALEGTAVDENGKLHFVCADPYVEGDITIEGDEATAIITDSSFPGIQVGEIYSFLDGEE